MVCGHRRPGDARSGLRRRHLRLANNDHFRLHPLHPSYNHRHWRVGFINNGPINDSLDNDGGTAARPHGPELSVDAAPSNAELSRSRTVTYRA